MDFVAALEIRSDKIALAVVIPKRTAIIPAADARLHFMQRLPWPRRVGRGGHEIALVRRTEIDPELVILKTNRTRPDAVSIAVHPGPCHVGSNDADIRHHVPQDRP